MPLIYVRNGYSNMGLGSLVTAVHACSHMGTAVHRPWKSSEKLKIFIISLALFDLSHQIVPQCEREPISVNHGLGWHGNGVGVTPPPQKNDFARTRSKVKN